MTQAAPETFYLVMRLCRFDSAIETDEIRPGPLGFPVRVHLEWGDGPEWFLPVFRTRADAQEWADNGKYAIRQIQPEIDPGTLTMLKGQI